MTTSRVKPRVQFQGRTKHGGKNNKHHPVKPEAKHTNNDAHDLEEAPKGRIRYFERYRYEMNPLTGSVYAFSVPSGDRTYDDDGNLVDEDAMSFPKEHVLTTDDQESDGAFESGLGTALILCRDPLVAENPDAAGSDADEHDHGLSSASKSGHTAEPNESCVPSVPVSLDSVDSIADENDEPPDSVLMRAPLWLWPAEWFPADSFPVAPETTPDPCPEEEDDTAVPSSAEAETTVEPFQATEETTVDPSPVAEESTVVSSSMVAETTSDLSSVSAETISDLSSEPSDATAGPSSTAVIATAGVTTTALHPAAAVTTVSPTPVTVSFTANLTPAVVNSTVNPSLGPWHQWVVNLFAGSKSGQIKSNKSPQPAPGQPVSIISWIRECSNSEPEIILPPLPRLELPTVLAGIHSKKNSAIRYPGLAVDIPQAPDNHYIGRAVMEGKPDSTGVVQRGFRVANSIHLAPLAQRRNNSDSSLLDRDGDAWAAWNKLDITADGMPFRKPQSDTDLLHPQTGAKMPQNTTMYNADQTKGQTGHCFLEDAGHRYPFEGLGL